MPAVAANSAIVIGAGITGLAAAHELLAAGVDEVTVLESSDRVGGNIRTSPFHGVSAVDEGADAFLARLPTAVGLAERVGLSADLVSPTEARAAVWYPRRGQSLHPIPDGLLLGVPTDLRPFAASGLMSVAGKARAALEPVLRRTSTADDCLGAYSRARLGDEVHERLVDALIGSIYAANTDDMSLRAVPQLAGLAETSRSLVLGGRRARRSASTAATGPIFATPSGGVGALVDAVAAQVRAEGGQIHTGVDVERIERNGDHWSVDGRYCDIVLAACPARVTASILTDAAPQAAALLRRAETAGVIIVTIAVDGSHWPSHLHGRSGYLVPKPVQRLVTAVSFGSQKWAHWSTPDGSQILRISLGRDGVGVDHLDDDAALATAVAEVSDQLGFDIEPLAVRVTRWPTAFPQYRPHHHEWVAAIDAALPSGLAVIGASYRGIGIPACVGDAQRAVGYLTA